MITRILSYMQRIFTDSGKEGKIHPLVCIAFTVVLSSVILFSSYHVIVFLFIVLLTALIFLLDARVLLSITIVSVLILLPYILSALIVQVLMGYQYYNIVLVNSIRIINLVFLSAIIVSLIDEIRLVIFLSKFSSSLALLALLTIKMVQIILVNLDELRLVYSNNLKCSKTCRLTGLLKALTYSSIMDTLNTVEAFYTRKHLLLVRRYKHG